MNLSVIVASKNFNNVDYLVARTNLFKLIDFGAEILFILYQDDYIFNSENDYSSIRIITSQKNGIYDSYNLGIKLSTKEFYLILGDDDIFLGNISLINNLLAKSDFDLYVFNVIKNRKVVKGYFPSKLYTTVLGIFPSHTGGMLIKNELHSEFGFYSLKFKVLADQLFLLGCILKNKVIKYESAVISIVGEKGFSSNYDMSILELRKIIHELRLGIVPLCFSYILQCKRRIRNKWGKLKF